jgi:hypothetical protein
MIAYMIHRGGQANMVSWFSWFEVSAIFCTELEEEIIFVKGNELLPPTGLKRFPPVSVCPHLMMHFSCTFSSLYLQIRLYDTAIRLGQLQKRHEVPVDPEEYARDNLKFGLVEVVYEWAKVHTRILIGLFSKTSVKF